jgi:DNA polymerase IV (archaeal DinB-like DNA polymerase)
MNGERLTRRIAHLDLDAFYTSVEQRENPDLRGKPLIIGAAPKQGKGRGVVVACSYEARKQGVRSGQPISVAYRLLPDAIYMQPDHETYANVSSDVMSLLKEYADRFEQASIDEAYLDITKSCQQHGGPIKLAERMKDELKQRTGLTCSIGIAPNKSGAKIASDMHKPDGLTIIEEHNLRETLAPLPVSRIPGVGPKTERSLNEIGIRTIGELAKCSPQILHDRFGRTAVWLWGIANGEERVEVQENFAMKSIGAEHTFEHDTEDWSEIDRELNMLTRSVHNRLAEENMACRTVVLKIRFKGFETHTRSRSVKFPTTQEDTIKENIRELCSEFKLKQKQVRLVGVRLASLQPTPTQTIESLTNGN